MAANLRLVAHATWQPYDKFERAVTKAKKLDQFLVMPVGGFKAAEQPKSAYSMLAIVIAVHAAILAWMLVTAADDKVQEKVMAPMMVSLLNAPIVTEPKVVPETRPAEPEPVVVKKQKPVLKQQIEQPVRPVTDTVSHHPEESKVAEQPAVAEAAAKESPVKAESPAQVVEAPAKAEPQGEPVIEPPRFGAAYLNNPAPAYPSSARRLGEQGRVLLKVLVSESGLAESVQLDTSSGYEKLDRAAIEAVKKWSFIPARRSNQPISAYVLVPVKFSLGS